MMTQMIMRQVAIEKEWAKTAAYDTVYCTMLLLQLKDLWAAYVEIIAFLSGKFVQ